MIRNRLFEFTWITEDLSLSVLKYKSHETIPLQLSSTIKRSGCGEICAAVENTQP